MKVFNEFKTRGVEDILIAVADGLKGIPEALTAVYLFRNRLDFGCWKDRKALAAALKPIYKEASAEAAASAPEEFEAGPWSQSQTHSVQPAPPRPWVPFRWA